MGVQNLSFLVVKNCCIPVLAIAKGAARITLFLFAECLTHPVCQSCEKRMSSLS